MVNRAMYVALFQSHFQYLTELHAIVQNERYWHGGLDCAGCSVQIICIRYQCIDVKPRFNLCAYCYAEGRVPLSAAGKEQYTCVSYTSNFS